MTWLEFFLSAVILIAIIAFIMYYYFKGSTSELSISRPIEGRVDEYLDRHFEEMVSEWSLADKYQVRSFCNNKNSQILADESKTAVLKDFKESMNAKLTNLEERLNVLEEQIPGK
ncbi:hypothetical protein F1737_02585 [Methanoplanus sp. FWC-SCC4]|uniref:Uncharacterized protein n=1 Tax=Methanochimaera problematica TaxID=2609417 RepID=A0AA97FA35_9EURY|nr:hypothetical protein [Methanoplanus sp. FWC-SCC4]WOF15650.1 hypothetical protein F1737_02585 [Methanoplanus sp. FWC-SCC4]